MEGILEETVRFEKSDEKVFKLNKKVPRKSTKINKIAVRTR